MSIRNAQPILTRRAPVGMQLIHKVKSCSASKGIVKTARFSSFTIIFEIERPFKLDS